MAPASFSGACPQTYIFSGNLTSVGAGKISYKLEATSDQAGFVFDLPAPVETTFSDAGPRTFTRDGCCRIAGDEMDQREDEREDPEGDRNHLQQAAEDVLQHGRIIVQRTCMAESAPSPE